MMNNVRGGRVPGDGVLTHERWGGPDPPDPPVDPPLYITGNIVQDHYLCAHVGC